MARRRKPIKQNQLSKAKTKLLNKKVGRKKPVSRRPKLKKPAFKLDVSKRVLKKTPLGRRILELAETGNVGDIALIEDELLDKFKSGFGTS